MRKTRAVEAKPRCAVRICKQRAQAASRNNPRTLPEKGLIMGFIARWIATAVAVGAAVWLVPGIEVIGETTWVGVVLMSLVLSLVNMSVKPIAHVLSLPITVLTLGIFYLVINTLMLYLAAWIANGLFGAGFAIDTFGSGFVAAIVVSIVSGIVNGIMGNND